MNSRERILSALALKEPDVVPFGDWIDEGARLNLMKSMGEKKLNDAQLAKRLNMDALIFYSDQYIAPQFCKKITGSDGRVHLQDEGFIQKDSDLDKMILPDLAKENYFDKAKRYIEMYGGHDLAICCGLRSGMMNTIYSMGWLNFAMALADNVNLVKTIEVDAEVKTRIQKRAPGGGYILGTANSITDYCKPENIIAMAEAKEKYGHYQIA
ncbi:MAG: hypothetical protein ACE5D6_06525 [Candidatus Zixiibacteriota bacterium]